MGFGFGGVGIGEWGRMGVYDTWVEGCYWTIGHLDIGLYEEVMV